MWTLGIDPGLTETGIVLLAPEGQYLAGVTLRADREGPDLERIENLADAIVGVVRGWVWDNSIREALIGVEVPVLRSTNVDNYRKQASLLHAIEAKLWDLWGAGTVAEVSPSAAKRAATGDGAADKDAMVEAGPFGNMGDIPKPTREALSDAWGIALAARLAWGVTRYVELANLERRVLAPQFTTRTYWMEAR